MEVGKRDRGGKETNVNIQVIYHHVHLEFWSLGHLRKVTRPDLRSYGAFPHQP